MKFFKKPLDLVLVGTLLLAAFLNIYGIWQDQYANPYYTAAVTSMLQSFHNFFFASFDPGGFVTVDKPPVAFWVQTLFAFVFGVHGWSVILPQALAGVGSVLIVYSLVKPSFGKTAARLSALVAACTPIAVAVSRTNNVDSLLVFTLLTATWMLFKAVRTKSWLWSMAAFAVVGVAFNIKMLQAYMVLPAFYLYYLCSFNVNFKKKLIVLVSSTVALLMVSLSWPLVVDSIPTDSRPYIGSSQTNSVLELAFGYNGIARLTGQGGPGGDNQRGQNMEDRGQMADGSDQPLGNPGQMPRDDGGNSGQRAGDGGGSPGQGPGSGGGMFNTGTAGPLRLFKSELSGQISWLLPFALIGAAGLLLGVRHKQRLTDKHKEALFWLAWLLPMLGFFSVAQFFHQYYLIMLAPAIAALTGAGWVELRSFNRQGAGWKKWLLPIGILGTTLFQLYILLPYRTQIGLGLPIVVGLVGIGLSLYLSIPRLTRIFGSNFALALSRSVALAGILILLVAPLYWATTPMINGGNSMLPAAGPQSASSMPGKGFPQGQGPQGVANQSPEDSSQNQPDGFMNQSPAAFPNQFSGQGQGKSQETVNSKLLAYLTANNTGEKYLFATANAGTAEAYIIQTGQAVMSMGGFSGSDPILTVEKLKQMIANHEVKYFLSSTGGPGGGNSEVQTWITDNGKVIPQSEWQSGSQDSNGTSVENTGRDGGLTLYEITP